MRFRNAASLAAALFLSVATAGFGAEPGWKMLSGHVPAALAHLTPLNNVSATNKLTLAIGLPLRDQGKLDELVQQLYDPASTNYHQFLTSQEFTARFGPTEEDYEAVIQFAERNGLSVSGRHSNRLVLDVTGTVANIERAFQVTMRTYRHPTEPRNFFAPDTEPSVPTNLPVADMWGLSDFALPTPLVHKLDASKTAPLNYNGSGPGGSYQGGDFRNAYVPGTELNGAGQTLALAEFDGYFASDITNYEVQSGYTNLPFVPLQNVLVDNVSGLPGYSGVPDAVIEVSLDIEMAVAMAPGLSNLVIYEGNSPYDVFNKIATDNSARQISCSWYWTVGHSHNWLHGRGTSTLDSILIEMVAQGQEFFEASGDNDAYTGSQALSSSSGPIPMDSIYVTSVGGTSLNMNDTGASWSSESAWNWGDNQGTGGGISPNYTIPTWQTNISMAVNSGSSVQRNIPDVALTADAINVLYSNGVSGTFGGTSCAAPLWAGFCALANQSSLATKGTTLGFLNPALYAISSASCYANCFHDITTGNNIGNNTAGLFYAVPGYDLCTGLGTPNGTNLINALVWPPPSFLTRPVGRNVTNGVSVTLSATVSGTPPFGYSWLFNGTNLSDGGNISGSASNVLSITAAATSNTGGYQIVVTNITGSITSSLVVLNVGFVPAVSVQPTNLIILSGGTAVFNAAATGSTPLFFQWRKSATNLTNGTSISGATSNVVTLANVTTNSSGSYTVQVTNIFGAATSSVAMLTVVLPPAIAKSSLTNRLIQCGSNNVTFSITPSGTPPLNIQWSLDATPVFGATNATFSVTNLHFPNHTIGVILTNLYGSAASNTVLTVQDTIAPAITLFGANPIYVELGGAFTDPGATAADICAGAVGVIISGAVNSNAVGTNTLTYSADDGNGNTGIATRTVIVRDTTPPTILWSFTNLVLAADTNCSAAMPDVTGTNYILATDLSGALTISQSPASNSILFLGTNTVVITVEDASGNATFSTNQIVLQDQTPPLISGQPQNETNMIGETANFSVAASACTPLAFQWYFNNGTLAAQTNSTLTLTNVSLASAGDYSVVVTASGGSSTSGVATLAVNLPAPAVALASSENPAGFQDNLNFTAALTPASATGTVQFFTNGTAFDLEILVAGQAASANVSSLPRGTNLVTAVYSGDANFSPATISLEQIVTNHPPTAAPAFYTNVLDAALLISIADLATNWSDADGDTISLVAVGTSADGITLTNNGTALVYFNPDNLADEFVCTIADGFGGACFQIVSIAPAAPPNTTPGIVGVAGGGDGSVTLSLTGASGYNYILETTTNLFPPGNWLPVATNQIGTNGVWQFNDTQATNFTQRFYRLKLSQ